MFSKFKTDFIHVLRRATDWSRKRLPWGLRSVLGVIFLVLGFRVSAGDWILDDICGGRSDRTRCSAVAKAAETLAARAE